jgi:hypothetical protein
LRTELRFIAGKRSPLYMCGGLTVPLWQNKEIEQVLAKRGEQELNKELNMEDKEKENKEVAK